jgi:hypothetical protein
VLLVKTGMSFVLIDFFMVYLILENVLLNLLIK